MGRKQRTQILKVSIIYTVCQFLNFEVAIALKTEFGLENEKTVLAE